MIDGPVSDGEPDVATRTERPSGTQLRSEPPHARGTPCARCAAPLEDQYYELNGRATCPSCRRALDGNLLVAGLVASLAGAACTLLYYAIWQVWDLRFSLIAVIAGVVVGNVVRRFAGMGSRTLARWVAVGITYLSVAATYVHSVMDQFYAAPVWTVLRSSLLLPFGMIYEGSNVVTLVLLGFGLHEAWQFSKAPVVHEAGPFRVDSE
jgi:hypothetical protein